MIEVWDEIIDTFDSLEDFKKYISRFPEVPSEFYDKFRKYFFDENGNLLNQSLDDFKKFLDDVKDPNLAAILLRSDGLGLEAWNAI